MINGKLITDKQWEEVPTQSWVDCRNMMIDGGWTSLINEYGFDVDNCNFEFPCNGIIPLPDAYIRFSCGRTGVFPTSIENWSKIEYVKDGVSTTIVRSVHFNFKLTCPIIGVYKQNYLGEVIIAWCDGTTIDANPPRILNINNLGFEIDGNKELVNSNQIKLTYLFPHFNIPSIETATASIGNPTFGGRIPTGAIQFAVAYNIPAIDKTIWAGITNPFLIKDKIARTISSGGGARTINLSENIDFSQERIYLDIHNIDTAYTKLTLAVIFHTESGSQAAEVGSFPITGTDMVNIMFDGKTQLNNIPLDSLLVPRFTCIKSHNITTFNDSLILNNVEVNNIEYQKWANAITLSWVSTTKAIASTINDMYRCQYDFTIMKTFCPDEVYAFYFIPVYLDGVVGEGFHIPGREPELIAKGYGWDGDYLEDTLLSDLTYPGDCTYGESATLGALGAKYFHTRDTSCNGTAGVQTSGKLGFWENQGETYPDTDAFDVVALDGTKTGSLRPGQIRNLLIYETFLPGAVDILNDNITVVDANIYPTGTRICFTGSDLPDPLAATTEYYSIWVDATHIEIALTFADAIAGTRLNILDVGSGTNTLYKSGVNPASGLPVRHHKFPAHETIYANGANLLVGSKALGISVGNINIPTEIRNKIQGFYIGYAKRTDDNISLLGYSPLVGNDYDVNPVTPGMCRFYDFGLLKIQDHPTINPSYLKVTYISAGTTSLADPRLHVIGSKFNPQDAVVCIDNWEYVPYDNSAVYPVNTSREEYIKLTGTQITNGAAGSINYLNSGHTDHGEFCLSFLHRYNATPYYSFDNQKLINCGTLTRVSTASNTYTVTNLYGGDTFITSQFPVTYQPTTPPNKSYFSYPSYSTFDTQFAKNSLEAPTTNYSEVYLHMLNSTNRVINQYFDPLSKLNELGAGYARSISAIYTDKFPRNLHLSNVMATESLSIKWREFLAANYYIMKSTGKGDITSVININDETLLIHQQLGLFKASFKDVLATDSLTAYLTRGGLFDRDPNELFGDDHGYLGNSSRFSSFVYRGGYFFVDKQSGRIFVVSGDEVIELSKTDVKQFLRTNLETYYVDIDNPFNNNGLTAVVDERYDRLIFCKREGDSRNDIYHLIPYSANYVPIYHYSKSGQIVNIEVEGDLGADVEVYIKDSSQYTCRTLIHTFSAPYVAYAYTPAIDSEAYYVQSNGNTITKIWINGTFVSRGTTFTGSYHLGRKHFIGLHDYNPAYLFRTREEMYAVSNGLTNSQFTQIFVDTAVNIGTDQITVTSDIYPTGTKLLFTGSSLPSPLVAMVEYYSIRIDASHIQVANTLAEALAGTQINLTTTGDTTNKYLYISAYTVFKGNSFTNIALFERRDVPFTSYIDLVFNAGSESHTWQAFNWITEVYRNYVNQYDRTFDAIMIYNNTQCSGIIPISKDTWDPGYIARSWFDNDAARSIDGKWWFDNFRDAVINNKLAFLDINRMPNANVNKNLKDYFDLSLFISTFIVIRLIKYNTIITSLANAQDKILLNDINTLAVKTAR